MGSAAYRSSYLSSISWEHLVMACLPGRRGKKQHMTSLLSCFQGWCKAAVGQPRRDSSGQLGLQHLWPEELLPGRPPALRAGTHGSRGHGPAQYQSPSAGAPRRPARAVPFPRWGLCKMICCQICSTSSMVYYRLAFTSFNGLAWLTEG